MEAFIARYYRIIFVSLLIAIAISAFYVGILEGKQSANSAVILSCSDQVLSELSIPIAALAQGSASRGVASPSSDSAPATYSQPQGAFAGSKNGTKYYTPDCAGLNRIKPENIIWFQSAQDATLQGYTPANC